MRRQKELAPKKEYEDKLQQYHQLAKDIIERARKAQQKGDTQSAAQLYSMCLEAVKDAQKVKVPPHELQISNSRQYQKDLKYMAMYCQARSKALDNKSPPSFDVNDYEASTSKAKSSKPLPFRPSGSNKHELNLPSVPKNRPGSSSNQGKQAELANGGGDDDKYRQAIRTDLMEARPNTTWDQVSGLALAKQSLQEAVILPISRPDLFTGLRAPARGILLYGPPGNGKTMLARAVASQSKATFFNISAASLTSKWHGEGEKLVRALFEEAESRQPSIVFIDEVDSLLSARSAGENEATRRLKTEFLVQFDGLSSGGNSRTIVLAATNCPGELDEAARRRFVKRIYIPMPDAATRQAIVAGLMKQVKNTVNATELARVSEELSGYSASDIAGLCKEAAMVPVRELGSKIAHTPERDVRPVRVADLVASMRAVRPSVSREQIEMYENWTKDYGTSS